MIAIIFVRNISNYVTLMILGLQVLFQGIKVCKKGTVTRRKNWFTTTIVVVGTIMGSALMVLGIHPMQHITIGADGRKKGFPGFLAAATLKQGCCQKNCRRDQRDGKFARRHFHLVADYHSRLRLAPSSKSIS